MKKINLLSVLITAAFSMQDLQAQDSTGFFESKAVSLENVIGDKRQFLQLLVNKAFGENNKTGVLSISSYAADYKEDFGNKEFQNTTLIYHHLFKGISINSGASFTSVEGLKNFVGLQYIYQGKTLSVLYFPSYYFINNHKISNLALIEYKPAINSNWSVYSRLQLHYNHDFEDGNHFRSYAYSRLGLTYKYFSFGLAHNYDRYGAERNTKRNYGVFLKLTL